MQGKLKYYRFKIVNSCKFRVVNVSSRGGLLKIFKSEDTRKKYLDSNLTIQTITSILKQFIE
jgi:hypothetical protein